MEAHNVLAKKGYNVCSFGTNLQVKIPGPSPDKPNTYPFGTTYDQIYNDLVSKDPSLYTQNGLLQIMDRNRKIKPACERFQDTPKHFDVIITCEERCYDIVCEDLMTKPNINNQPVFVINFEIKDNLEDAAMGARAILHLASMLEESQNLEQEFDTIMDQFQEKSSFPILYSVCYY